MYNPNLFFLDNNALISIFQEIQGIHNDLTGGYTEKLQKLVQHSQEMVSTHQRQ